MGDTFGIGVRIDKEVYDSIKRLDPSFNLSEFVRRALLDYSVHLECEVFLRGLK